MKKEKEVYDFIVSMGAACACSQILRACNLQDFSYPYDWIAGIPLKGRIELMLSGFKDWFHIEDFVKVGNRLHPEPCDIYRNVKTDLTYVHDFPLNIPLEEAFEKIKKRYERRTSRMLENIEKAQKILFVYMETPEINNIYSVDYLLECLKILKDRYPDKDIKIRYFYLSKDEPSVVKQDGIEIYKFDYTSQKENPQSGDINMNLLKMQFKNVKLYRKLTFKRVKDFIFNYRVVKREYMTKITVTIMGLKFRRKIEKRVEIKNNE